MTTPRRELRSVVESQYRLFKARSRTRVAVFNWSRPVLLRIAQKPRLSFNLALALGLSLPELATHLYPRLSSSNRYQFQVIGPAGGWASYTASAGLWPPLENLLSFFFFFYKCLSTIGGWTSALRMHIYFPPSEKRSSTLATPVYSLMFLSPDFLHRYF